VAHAIYVRQRILIEHAPFVVLLPVFGVHGIFADEFQEAETVVAVVGAGTAVDDELLACGWVCELFGRFVGAETVVYGAAVLKV
jgi:hypothetical protein